MITRRQVPIKARIAAWLYDIVGRWIVENAEPVWSAEIESEGWDDDPVGCEEERAYREGLEDGLARGYEEGRADPYDVGF